MIVEEIVVVHIGYCLYNNDMNIILPSVSAIAFSIGPYSIHWYGIFAAIAIAFSYWGWRRSYKIKGYNPEHSDILIFWIVIAGVIGARFYYILIDFSYYLSSPLEVFSIWNGGLAIRGALIGGAIALFIGARKLKISVLPLVNTLVPWLALGQAIGRGGNYVNQELYGKPTTGPLSVFIHPDYRITGFEQFSYFQPVFLYEFVGLVAIWLALFLVLRKKSHWLTTIFPLIWYFILTGLLRAGMELLRIDPMPMVFGVRISLFISLGISMLAAIVGIYVHRKTVLHSK